MISTKMLHGGAAVLCHFIISDYKDLRVSVMNKRIKDQLFFSSVAMGILFIVGDLFFLSMNGCAEQNTISSL